MLRSIGPPHIATWRTRMLEHHYLWEQWGLLLLTLFSSHGFNIHKKNKLLGVFTTALTGYCTHMSILYFCIFRTLELRYIPLCAISRYASYLAMHHIPLYVISHYASYPTMRHIPLCIISCYASYTTMRHARSLQEALQMAQWWSCKLHYPQIFWKKLIQ